MEKGVEPMARPGEGVSAEAPSATWTEILEETIIKHERSAERQLYVYGISVNRCPQCRSRIKPANKQCETCHYTLNVQRACYRCTDKAIEMWCYECDAYYCGRCYNRAHLLSRSGLEVKHSCFPIEGASGKSLAKGSWRDKFAAVVQSTYRLRITEKFADPLPSAAPTAAVSSRPVETASEVASNRVAPKDTATTSNDPVRMPPPSDNVNATTVEQPSAAAVSAQGRETIAEQHQQDDGLASTHTTPDSAPTNSSASAPASATTSAADSASASVSASPSGSPPGEVDASTPTAAASTESRKRPLGSEAHGELGKAKHQRSVQLEARPVHRQGEHSRVRSPPSSAELTLYEQVRLMHEKRQQKTATLPPRPPQQRQEQQQRQQQQQHQPHHQPQPQEQHTPQAPVATPNTPAQPSAPERSTPPPPVTATTLEVDESPTSSAPLTSPLAAEQRQQIMHELEQQQRHLQRAASVSSLSSASTAPLTQGIIGSQPPSQVAYPVQTVQSPLPSPFPSPFPSPLSSPMAPAGRQQYFGDMGVGLGSRPVHPSMVQPTVAVGFLRPSTTETTLGFPPATGTTIDLTGPVVHSRPQRLQASIAFQNPAGAAPPAGDVVDEDALLSAVLADFNSINAHVMELESKIQSMVNAVRMFSFQDVAKATTLNVKIAERRSVLERARARRIQVTARVMMYLPAVSEFARSADRGSWGDVPRVLTTCQTRLAQLAGDLGSCEQRVRQLRGRIDAAVSSNDAAQILQVQELGDRLKQEESRAEALRAERDAQFVLMIKFSRELREAVQQEVAALARNAQASTGGGSASSSSA